MKAYLVVVMIAIGSLFAFWLPFISKTQSFWGIEFGKRGMETIVQNFDGLNYLAVAKTLYDPVLLERDFAGFGNPPIYYSAHFPLYPLLIRGFDLILTGPQALLAATIVSNALLAIGLLYFFLTFVKDKKMALLLSVLCLFFPARMLSVRAVGTSEPLFIFFVLTSLAALTRGKHWLSAILGSLAVLTRSPGIFLFGAYVIQFTIYNLQFTKKLKIFFPYLLMPTLLGLLFAFYGYRLGDFWAYFNNSSELHPILFPPLLIFSNLQNWISGIWREEFVYLMVFYAVGLTLVKNNLGAVKKYGLIWGIFLLFVAHQDLARYALPLSPIALLGFSTLPIIGKAKWLVLLIIPIYLLGWQFVLGNMQPVADWTSLL